MKLEKDDRIISNADYEKLVGLAELHERAIEEVVTEIISKQSLEIIETINEAKNKSGLILNYANKVYEISEQAIDKLEVRNKRLELKNRIIQEKNAEIARLKKRWWKLI